MKAKVSLKVIGMVLVGLLLIAGASYGVWRFGQLQKEVQKLKSSPQAYQDAAKADVKRLVDQVAKLIALPADETPTIATVTDIEKLKNNAFFANAKNGDKVLLYSAAKKAVIFRPSDNKIIDVGPISIGTPSASTVTNPMKFVLYNGTNVTGLTKRYEKELLSKVPAATVVDKTNAQKHEYTTSLIIDISKNKSSQIAAIAKTLGIDVGSLPEGETAPSGADYLIIVGADKQ